METVKVSALPHKLPWVEGVDYTVIAGSPSEGDAIRERAGTKEVFRRHCPGGAPQPPAPKTLSKTDFNKLCWATLGMAAFQSILEAVRASTGTETAHYEARAAVQQYDSAQLFNKSEVQALGAKIVAGAFMSSAQLDAVLAAWP